MNSSYQQNGSHQHERYYYPSQAAQHTSSLPQNPAQEQQVLRQSTQHYISGGLPSSPGQLIPSEQKLPPPNFFPATQPGHASRMLQQGNDSQQNPEPPDPRFLNVAGEMIVIKSNTHEDVERKLIAILERTNRKMTAVVKKREETLGLVRKAEVELIEMTKMMDISNTHVEDILRVWKQLVNNEIPLKSSKILDVYQNGYNLRSNTNYRSALPFQNPNLYLNYQGQYQYQYQYQTQYQSGSYNGTQNNYYNSIPAPCFNPNAQMANYSYSSPVQVLRGPVYVQNSAGPVYSSQYSQNFPQNYNQNCHPNANSYIYSQNAVPTDSYPALVGMSAPPPMNPLPDMLTPRSSTEGADSVITSYSTRSNSQTPYPNLQMANCSNYVPNMQVQNSVGRPVHSNYYDQQYQSNYSQSYNPHAHSPYGHRYAQPVTSRNEYQVSAELSQSLPEPAMLTPRSSAEDAESSVTSDSSRSDPQTPHLNFLNEEVPLLLDTENVVDNTEAENVQDVVYSAETEPLQHTGIECLDSDSQNSSSTSPPVLQVGQSLTQSDLNRNNCRSYAEAVASGSSKTACSSLSTASQETKDVINGQNGFLKLSGRTERGLTTRDNNHQLTVSTNSTGTSESNPECSTPYDKRSEESITQSPMLNTVTSVKPAQLESTGKDPKFTNILAVSDQKLVDDKPEKLVIEENLPEAVDSPTSTGNSSIKKQKSEAIAPVAVQVGERKNELQEEETNNLKTEDDPIITVEATQEIDVSPAEQEQEEQKTNQPSTSGATPPLTNVKIPKAKKKKAPKKHKTLPSVDLTQNEMEEEDELRAAKNKITTKIKFYLTAQPILRSEQMIELPFGMSKEIETIIGFVNETSLFYEKEYIRLSNSYQNSKASSYDRLFFLVLLEQSIDPTYKKVIQQDTSSLRVNGDPKKIEKYVEAVTGFMSFICKKTIEEYLMCQVFRRNLNNTPPDQKMSEVEFELMTAAREDTDFEKDRVTTARSFLQQRKKVLKRRMVHSQIAASFLICYEILEEIDNPEHVSILNFDFDYLSKLPDQKLEGIETDYLKMFFGRFIA